MTSSEVPHERTERAQAMVDPTLIMILVVVIVTAIVLTQVALELQQAQNVGDMEILCNGASTACGYGYGPLYVGTAIASVLIGIVYGVRQVFGDDD